MIKRSPGQPLSLLHQHEQATDHRQVLQKLRLLTSTPGGSFLFPERVSNVGGWNQRTSQERRRDSGQNTYGQGGPSNYHCCSIEDRGLFCTRNAHPGNHVYAPTRIGKSTPAANNKHST